MIAATNKISEAYMIHLTFGFKEYNEKTTPIQN